MLEFKRKSTPREYEGKEKKKTHNNLKTMHTHSLELMIYVVPKKKKIQPTSTFI